MLKRDRAVEFLAEEFWRSSGSYQFVADWTALCSGYPGLVREYRVRATGIVDFLNENWVFLVEVAEK